MPGPSTSSLLDLLQTYYGTPEPGQTPWAQELPSEARDSPWLPVAPDFGAPGIVYSDVTPNTAKEHDEGEGRLPTLKERAGSNWLKEQWLGQGDKMREEVLRRQRQPWWSEHGNAYGRPDPESAGSDVFRALTMALAGTRGGYGVGYTADTPQPFTLPGISMRPGQQPLHYDGGVPRSLLPPLGAHTAKTRDYNGPLPPEPERLPRIPGPLDDNGREVLFPEGRPHQPSLLSQIAPQFVRDHIDLDHLVENPAFHARHIADPLIATWGLGAAGAEGAAATNALMRALGRIKPGLGDSKIEQLREAAAQRAFDPSPQLTDEISHIMRGVQQLDPGYVPGSRESTNVEDRRTDPPLTFPALRHLWYQTHTPEERERFLGFPQLPIQTFDPSGPLPGPR